MCIDTDQLVWSFSVYIFALGWLFINPCHAHFQFSANQITLSRLLILVHILNDKQCRSRLVGFCTVCKGRVYLDSAGEGLTHNCSRWHSMIFIFSKNKAHHFLKDNSLKNVKPYFLWIIKYFRLWSAAIVTACSSFIFSCIYDLPL